VTRPMGPVQTYGTSDGEHQTYGTPEPVDMEALGERIAAAMADDAPGPTDFEALWRSAIRALAMVGSQVRSLRAEVEALRGEPK
jgi:hypothetical protein